MTGMRKLLEVDAKMPEKPTPMRDLQKILDYSSSYLSTILRDMESLGLVVREPIDRPGVKSNRVRIGWRKTIRK